MALRDHLLGDPERLDAVGLARGIRRGSGPFAVGCVRALGERAAGDAAPVLLPLLADGRAGVRRAAAASLGHLGSPVALPALREAAARERTEEGALAFAVARARCGDDVAAVRAELARLDRRVLPTHGGPRQPAAAQGRPPLPERLDQCLGTPPTPRDALLAARRDALARAADPRAAARDLAALRHPDDLARVRARFRAAGRRGEHALVQALGLLGDPRALRDLRDTLRATDVDPGHGFAQRRLAAAALGQIGLADAVPWLRSALEAEARDHEGRPGAGLGVQYPVRADLLWALGEIADEGVVPVLLGYLGDTQGSALGGFYLPAMDALRKIGPAALPALRRFAREAPEIAGANAVGVLVALGDDVSAWRADARAPVRLAAEGA
ncbi:MAG: HEAT repeat domain-containing protein [Myxococcota bacterium]